MRAWERRLRAAAGRVLRRLPESVQLRWFADRIGYSTADIPPPVVAPDAPVRLYIAPANFAGQGYAWARAAERLEGVGAVSMQYRSPGDLGYATDYEAPKVVVGRSRRWGREQFRAVAGTFSHVIIETQWPIFGERFGQDVRREVRALRRAGVAVASLCHGSDIRLPSRHRAHEPHSPFHDPDFDLGRVLEAEAARKAALLDEIDEPEFVSTPDLLLDRPKATWLPVAIEPERWRAFEPPLQRERPITVHAPSRASLKGTELVEPALHRLSDDGVIDYRRIERIPSAAMPKVIAEADIVLDQFSLGLYGVAAAEAMAAGRLVVSHVSEFVRDTVRRETGLELPIVEADADTIDDVLRDVRARPAHYREVAARGPAFVTAVHDGRRSAEALAPFLGR